MVRVVLPLTDPPLAQPSRVMRRGSRRVSTTYEVIGDSIPVVYSRHRTLAAAVAAADRLARRWGMSQPSTEPRVRVDNEIVYSTIPNRIAAEVQS